ncbi:Anaphase-promoting complex subunit 8 [Cyphellophora attinorum]|uniref:Anaphase-promoting complex subunit 8 n=1 Tax=Cyphellophora attinorum TaxID=1664694 RepID=A0A0N0NKF8_9EURO|nr:Anaphase-promoting complex subunit 8 [Phialophora attinorum]KPI37988.1 Anaphase-promoting complex subunit 8 [Phialophora attinorum]
MAARHSFGAAATDPELIAELRDRLTEVCIKCSERCLYQSAKWAAELLDSLPEQEDSHDGDSQMLNADAPQSSYRTFSTSYDDPIEASLEAREAPKYLLAKTYFDTKEYDRCAAVFISPAIPAGGLAIFDTAKSRQAASSVKTAGKAKADDAPVSPYPRLSQKSLFLALYAKYLSGEKRKEEETEMVLGPADGGQTVNRELPTLARGLEGYFRHRDAEQSSQNRSQGWLEFLYGIVLARSKQEAAAQNWLVRSVRLQPYLWGAWEELAALLSTVDDLHAQLASNLLPNNIMTIIYQTHAAVDLFSTNDASQTFSSLQTLLSIFPTSTFLLTQMALCHYHSKDFDTSSAIFADILTTHPYRLDALDHYSNILYVMEDRPRLSFLVHLATSVDKFRPETCVVVGNYYSICSQHEKAVMYFRRALTLDRSFLSAWTLMGHEYIELKNTHAAIESYRRAVDVNRKDYRAWYGLGQAYEVLDMGFYALFYYQRAAGLRPYDPKMWQAVGSCYTKMGRDDQAIKALKRALVAGTYFETADNSPQQSFAASIGTSGPKAKKRPTGRKLLDPETLHSIAALKGVKKAEKSLRKRAKKEARKADIAAERRRHRDATAGASYNDEGAEVADDATDVISSPSEGDSESEDEEDMQQQAGAIPNNSQEGGDGFGTGTTPTTSKARLWLARYAFRKGDLDRAERLAEELCADGFEVEEAKSLVRMTRGQREVEEGAL